MQFDEAQYVENFVKKHRGTRGVPGDPMARYAITLPATDVEIAAQVKAVREYWNKASRGMSNISQVAKLCRAEDERLRAQHGTKMETRAWWLERQSDQQKAAEASITVMVDDLRRHYGTLGVVTPGVLNQFAAKLGLTPAQATQAAERAGLKVITGLSLPDTEPIGNFAALEKQRGVVMDSRTIGIPLSSPEGYKITAQYAVRVTWSGVYVHSAPWSVDSQGYSNVSHGCINLSPDNAAWYFNQVNVGDPIQVVA